MTILLSALAVLGWCGITLGLAYAVGTLLRKLGRFDD